MDNEKIERQMEFIIDQQAKFSVDIEKLKESFSETDSLIKSNARQIDLANQNIIKLTDALMTLTKFAQNHEGQIADLATQTKQTDDRLNALINVVENSITGRKN